MKRKKILPLVISIFLVMGFALISNITILAATIYLSNGGDDSNNGLNQRTAVKTLLKAYELVQDGDIIYVIDTIDISDTDNITVTKEITITGTGEEYAMLKRITGNTTSLITVDRSGKLTLENIIIDGGAVWEEDKTNIGLIADDSLIKVYGELITNVGAVIRNNYNYYDFGGGVCVDGIFIMNDGLISSNFSKFEGGGVCVDGIFTMKNGSISNNSAEDCGGGVYVFGKSTFIMENGSISNNFSKSGGGIFVSIKAISTMNEGLISYNSADFGGGVCVGGIFTMNGGLISYNSANNSGGGVSVYGTYQLVDWELVRIPATFELSGSSQIINNTKGTTPNNIYLLNSSLINLIKDFTGSAGITLENDDNNGIKVQMDTTEFNGINNIFSDENNLKCGSYEDGKIVWKYINDETPIISTNLITYKFKQPPIIILLQEELLFVVIFLIFTYQKQIP